MAKHLIYVNKDGSKMSEEQRSRMQEELIHKLRPSWEERGIGWRQKNKELMSAASIHLIENHTYVKKPFKKKEIVKGVSSMFDLSCELHGRDRDIQSVWESIDEWKREGKTLSELVDECRLENRHSVTTFKVVAKRFVFNI